MGIYIYKNIMILWTIVASLVMSQLGNINFTYL
jgi:hypothetical protein